ncbi:MAG: adenylyltransferase/cytidyltransferase family protein [Candidatus Pacearchaeota archaeon]|jgi:D-beta-D-heptose 7-phosphate kinase/D-beta-D-heptose 1-phosphate adenosyltransferase
MDYKIRSYKEIFSIAKNIRENKKTIATTNGSFDILHYAHVNLLERAANEANCLIVLLNSDDSIKRFKGENRPIIPQKERALMLSALECVDYITIFNEDTPLELLKIIKPNIHIKGGSFVAERIAEEQKVLSEWGGKFKNYELEEGYSSTNIINRILETYNANS